MPWGYGGGPWWAYNDYNYYRGRYYGYPRFHRGWWWSYPGYGYPYQLTPEEEKNILTEDLKELKEEMKSIEERLKELENSEKK